MLKKTISTLSVEIIEPQKELGEIHSNCYQKKVSTLIESQYVLSE